MKAAAVTVHGYQRDELFCRRLQRGTGEAVVEETVKMLHELAR